ncbi:uncharacterized protein LOC125843245 [Solanum stenotomum]|uniref:uncharacterized protein LOC125843245 n=1 Tax=Solanum stenotomum TaxID=172797 RepID=UPI0020D1657C|nr:uncharacterized protein LOC125843245 [Solanum stenotomum]
MDSKLMKPLPKTLMLKDYLLDDLSSCSSSGFRSYPRRQCCTTVRFLLEIDLKNKYQPALPPPPYKTKPILRSKLSPPSAATATAVKVSAFQKASVAVINAVKHLPFAGVRSSSTSKKKKPMMRTIFPRSISRKLKRSFWKRGDHKEIYWWTAFNRLDKEELKSPVFSPVVIGKIAGDSNSSTTTVNKSKCNSNTWSSDSDFTASSDNSLQTSSGNSEVNSTETVNDAVASKKLGTENVICSKKVGATTVDDSSDSTIGSHGSTTNSPNTKKPWPNEEKEQFSPVSTLDCPFDDEDEVSSPFQHRLTRVEGTTKKLMKKIKRFECLTELEPLNLDKRIASSESESESPLNNSSESEVDEEEEDKQRVERQALDMVQELKESMPSYTLKLKTEKLLFDFFKERILNGDDEFKNKPLELAQDWINGKPIDVLLDWKVQENRMAYIRAIETRGEWKNTELEKQEVILELEVDIFASLMNEVLVDVMLS